MDVSEYLVYTLEYRPSYTCCCLPSKQFTVTRVRRVPSRKERNVHSLAAKGILSAVGDVEEAVLVFVVLVNVGHQCRCESTRLFA